MFIVFILLLLSLFAAAACAVVVVVVIRILCTFQEINKKKKKQNSAPKGQANSLKTSREREKECPKESERARHCESRERERACQLSSSFVDILPHRTVCSLSLSLSL